MTQLENALWALRRGFRVLPCQMGGKDPNRFLVGRGGSHNSTSDEGQVRRWWSASSNGNVGINGGVIVDVDDGVKSFEEAEAWRERTGLPPTLAVRTGRRSSYGVQYHYSGHTNSSPYEVEGISGEVRGWPLYGLAPGSIHPDTGERYEVVADLPIAPFPADCLLERLRKKTVTKLNKMPSKLKEGEKIKPSFRQYWLVSQCGRLRRTGLHGEGLFCALRNLCNEYCERPEEKTDAMVRQICDSSEKNYGVTVPDSTSDALLKSARAEQAIAALESDKKADPMPAIEVVGAVGDAARRKLLIGRLAALRISGLTRQFIEQQISECRDKAEGERKEAAASSERSRLAALGETICGAELLDRCCAFIRRFVLLSEEQALVVTAWVAHTHALNASEHTPYLAINSPEKRSGKTRLLEVLKELVAKPWLTGRVSAAVLPRKIELEQPTLLLDESDAAFGGEKEYAEALRGILNTGHKRGGVTTICVKVDGNFIPHDFSTFCPKAIAGIGKLPDTVADRSISIHLKRKKKGEKEIARFRLRDEDLKAETAQLHEGLAAYSAANLERLRDARPELPDALNDRQQDGAEPLLAVADAAGGEWPEKTRRAIVMLCAEEQAAEDSIGVRLLSDIRSIFDARGVDRLPSAELADALAEIETSPWSGWSRGKPITASKIARLLNPFGVTPGTVRFCDSKIAKGYYAENFTDPWARYLPTHTLPTLDSGLSKRNAVTRRINTSDTTDFESVTPPSCNGNQDAQIVNKDAACNGVTFSNREIEETREEGESSGIPARIEEGEL